jgi:hypothetical protein
MAEWDKSRWYLMSGLLDELLESDVVTRATRLLQLRTEDPLLADQIAELLSQHAQTQMDHFLEGSAVEPLGLATLAGRSIGTPTAEPCTGISSLPTSW